MCVRNGPGGVAAPGPWGVRVRLGRLSGELTELPRVRGPYEEERKDIGGQGPLAVHEGRLRRVDDAAAGREGPAAAAGARLAAVPLYFVKLTCMVSSLFLDSFVVHSGRFGLSGFPLVLFGCFISEWVFLWDSPWNLMMRPHRAPRAAPRVHRPEPSRQREPSCSAGTPLGNRKNKENACSCLNPKKYITKRETPT